MLFRSNIKRTNTLVIFINQIRMKIGILFGNPETTTGEIGRASCRERVYVLV